MQCNNYGKNGYCSFDCIEKDAYENAKENENLAEEVSASAYTATSLCYIFKREVRCLTKTTKFRGGPC